ncbi:MAG TPA: T9SS type A sorting domain-containing protein [Cytophagaceae bacterium]
MLAVCQSHAKIVKIIVSDTEQFIPSNIEVNVGDTIMWIHDPNITPSKYHSIYSSELPPTAEGFFYSFSETESQKSYVVAVPGTYNYYCYPHGPRMTGSFTALAVTSIEDKLNYNMTFFPNPFKSSLSVDFNEPFLGELNVIDAKGDVLQHLLPPLNGKLLINLSTQASGIYYLEFILNDKRVIKKILKE